VRASTGQWRIGAASGGFLGLGRAKGIAPDLMAEFLPDIEWAVSAARRKETEGENV
jgi:hypothetical protein